MHSELQRLARCVAVLACMLACSSSVPPPRTTPAADLTSARIDEETFALALSTPDDVSVGTPSTAVLSIEGRGIYHVNHEYPIGVVLRRTPDVALARSELTAADAAALSPTRARFELPFTCRTPGPHRLEAEVDFALCTEDACIPESRTIALTVRAHR